MDFKTFEKSMLYGMCSMSIFFLSNFYLDTQGIIKDRNAQQMRLEAISNNIRDLQVVQVDTLKSLNQEIAKLNSNHNTLLTDIQTMRESFMTYQGLKRSNGNGLILQMGLPGNTSVGTGVDLIEQQGVMNNVASSLN